MELTKRVKLIEEIIFKMLNTSKKDYKFIDSVRDATSLCVLLQIGNLENPECPIVDNFQNELVMAVGDSNIDMFYDTIIPYIFAFDKGDLMEKLKKSVVLEQDKFFN